MLPPRLLVIGTGKLGLPLAAGIAQDEAVAILSRNPPATPVASVTDSTNILPIAADVSQPASLQQLPPSIEVVVYCLSPGQFSDAAYEQVFVAGVRHLLHALRFHRLQRVIFVSSTGVYHQDDDSWVDEDSPTAPKNFSGKRLLEAESIIAASGIPATTVRFSGIYGAGRTRLLEQILAGEIDPQAAGPFTNRIHEQDCIGVLEYLARRALAGEPLASCYVASDNEPCRVSEIVQWVLAQIGNIQLQPHAGAAPRRAGSKRCRNQRLLESGYRFRFESFREGYGPILQALAKARGS